MQEVLKQLGIAAQNPGTSTGVKWIESSGKSIGSFSPVDGKKIADVICTDRNSFEQIIHTAQKAFLEWELWPSPKRGDVVRQIGDALRKNKNILGRLVSYEMGKSLQEGYGEV